MSRPDLIYQSISDRAYKGLKSLALLIDPDEVKDERHCRTLIHMAVENHVNYVLVGGSLITGDHMSMVLETVRRHSSLPSIIFPGNSIHVNAKADGILFLSLISGRNPEFLIGQQVLAAPLVKRSNLEVIPTGYILIDAGAPTTVSYISNTPPIPRNKASIAVSTALAGEMLGMKMIYMDAGSGAFLEIPTGMIKEVRAALEGPLVVGGGLNTREKAGAALRAGADVIVVGNGAEDSPTLLVEIAEEIQELNRRCAFK